MSTEANRTIRLDEERARRLDRLATQTGASPDALIDKALDMLFNASGMSDDGEVGHPWSTLSTRSLDRIWENDADAACDDWRSLYGLQ